MFSTPVEPDVKPQQVVFKNYVFPPVEVSPGNVTIEWEVRDFDGFSFSGNPQFPKVVFESMSVSKATVKCDSKPHKLEHIAFVGSAASELTATCKHKFLITPVLSNFNRDWRLRLNQLRVVNENEGSDDEPYFITIAFRSQFNTPGSTETLWNGHLA